jgi:phage shock protein PspC (stress-responsive transcriptional regulator)
MNKVLNINLGGYPFTIDEDAYTFLSEYLTSIHNHFRDSEGYEEITGDIEARMAELFQEQLSGRPIVTVKDIDNAIAIMGTPEDFGVEPVEEPFHEETSAKSRKYKTGKRLFRNPDDEVVGGVCSGLAAYFGIEDPVWIRIAWIVFTISGGLGIPAYIILWVIVPKAETAGDRLAMRGQKINVSNIGKIVEEEIESFSEKMEHFGSEFQSKKKELERLDLRDRMELEAPLRKGYHC